MGFFSKLFGGTNEDEIDFNVYLEFAKLISLDDEKVLSEVKELITHTDAFISKNKEFYENRGIDLGKWKRPRLIWMGFADILINNGFAEEFDWKCELECFESLLAEIKSFKVYDLELPPLTEDKNDVYEWIKTINTIWQEQGFCLMQMYIDSDSYVIFPIEASKTEFLETESKKINEMFMIC
jgi:hypothetical protein